MTFLVTLTYQTFSQSKSFALFDPNSVLFSLIKNPDCRHAFLALYSSLSPHCWSWHPYHQTHSLQFSPHSWACLQCNEQSTLKYMHLTHMVPLLFNWYTELTKHSGTRGKELHYPSKAASKCALVHLPSQFLAKP